MLGLRRKPRPPYSDCLPILLPLDLIGQRSKQLKAIQQLAGVPKAHWKSLYFDVLLAFAGYVQQLPASEAHHHPGAGGLLEHCLEVVIHALSIRRGHLLPQGADAEEITAKKDLWTYAIFTAALLHDIGKPLMDQAVTLYDRDGRELGTWEALTAPMSGDGWYRVHYRKDRQHRLHERAALLISRLILPTPALGWLGSDRVLLSAWLAAMSGLHEDAGVIGEIIQQADGQSVAENLGASEGTARLPGSRSPLHERLLTGLRFLLKENQVPLNRNGAAAWFDGERLWLVSKRGIDALREHLTREGHNGTPTRNDRIFDELQQNKVLIPNGDRSIWKVTIATEAWSHTLTCLCFPAAKIWPDPNARPEIFNGTIAPVDGDTETDSDTNVISESPVTTTTTPVPKHEQSVDQTTTDTAPGFDPVEFFSTTHSGESSSNTNQDEQQSIEFENHDQPENEGEDSGKLFRAWLHDGLRKDKFETNSVHARIHRVEEGLLLVSPGIFKDYNKEDWQRIQKRFQKLKIHRKTPQGTNIFTYQVTGKRNRSRVKGFLIEDPETVFKGVSLPKPNPHLAPPEET